LFTMSGRRQNSACMLASFLAAVVVGALNAPPAHAEGFFEFLFGKFDEGTKPAAPEPRFSAAPSRPTQLTVRPRAAGLSSRGTVFCVRMCDGRYFPIQRSATVQPSKICNSLCPAARTKVFAGADISRAVAADGSSYSGIDHAFLYREQTVDDCTCNGVTSYGLVTMDAREDPTLRAGDLVATATGLIRSTALPKGALHASAERDDEVTTGSTLPLGMRGNTAVSEDFVLRRSGPHDLLPIAVPLTIPAR
jgi:hypothetical protein